VVAAPVIPKVNKPLDNSQMQAAIALIDFMTLQQLQQLSGVVKAAISRKQPTKKAS